MEKPTFKDLVGLMGILRLLLAFSVVLAHTGPYFFSLVGGEIAVQIFFVISGFYISMVLRNSYKSPIIFWVNRLLRLLPAYYIVLALSLFIGFHDYIALFSSVPLSAKLFLIFTHVTLFFQDLTMFLGIGPHGLHFTTNIMDSSPPLFRLLLVPQAWSLGTEISFYILAPFLLRRSNWILILILTSSIVTRVLLIRSGYSEDPWSHRFFPSEIAFFLAGSLANRFYHSHPLHFKNIGKVPKLACLTSYLFLILFFENIPMEYQIKRVFIEVAFVFVIPYIFDLTKNIRMDRFIGDLSYPVYISHILIVTFYYSQLGKAASFTDKTFVYLLVLAFSIGTLLLIEKPIEKIRSLIKAKNP